MNDSKSSGRSSSRRRSSSRSPTRRREHSHANKGGNGAKNQQKQSSSSSTSSGSSSSSSSSRKGSDNQLSDLFKSMVKGAASSAAAKFTSGLGAYDDKDKTPSGTSGEFDLYLFAQTWAPRFCCTNRDKCKAQQKDGVDDLTIHGLWPAYNAATGKEGRTYPAYCPLGNDRKFTSNDKLAVHEFTKHGSCTKMSFEEYMDEGLKIENDDSIAGMSDFLNSKAGEIVSINDIYEEAGGTKRVAIQTSPYCQLQELTTCWAKAADGTVGEQIDCPTHVLGSSRNSALLNKCTKVSLEASSDEMKCVFISKELLKILKDPAQY